MQRYIRFAILVLVLPVTGCELGSDSLSAVRGKVTYRGVALNTGTIVFIPDELRGPTGPLIRAQIQPNGAYEVWTAGRQGAAAGWYRVTIMAIEPSSGQAGESYPYSLLPDKYRDPELSGLSCEIKANQGNVIDFDLD